MPPFQDVRVELAERSYDIRIGADVLEQAGPFLVERSRPTHAVVITDTHVEQPHAVAVAENLAEESVAVDLVVVEAGESSKSVEMANELWEKLLELGADRRTLVVAVGGGVVGDLAGFVAATFARGLRFFQIPTTLLAQVDSSVGGKVGINLPQAKNMVGAFLQPLGVLIDPGVLETLDDREYRAGLGEVVKYGVILDAPLFEFLEGHIDGLLRRDAEVLSTVIARCCQLKAEVVRQDEREETGLRAILNYGHTYGHAFEALGGYGSLLHGEAVAIGMLCASRLAERLGRIAPALTARQKALLTALQLPTAVPDVDPDEVLRTMLHDKKVAHGNLRFVLPSRLGHVDLVGQIDPDDARRALQE